MINVIKKLFYSPNAYICYVIQYVRIALVHAVNHLMSHFLSLLLPCNVVLLCLAQPRIFITHMMKFCSKVKLIKIFTLHFGFSIL